MSLSRRALIRQIAAVLLAACALAATASDAGGPPQPRARLNILWIIADDMGPQIGVAGSLEARAPNIDRLAREGVRCTHAFTTAPVCSPSRSAPMTGMYQTTIGAHNRRSHRGDGDRLPAGVRVITDWLREAGYYTANVRHLAADSDETFFRGTGKTDWNFDDEGKPFDSDRWDDLAAHQPFYVQINFGETHRGAGWDHAHEHIRQRANPA